MVPNFEPKKTQNVNFEWFLGPNDSVHLFSHYTYIMSRPEKVESMGGGTVASGAPIVDTKSKEYRRDKAFLSIIIT